ncbi:hypothetical protein B0H10DRAFT_12952 [Mycena sp. CBHHK59/15]|nr:hypothetical protein B0H10DRAFT_12952 [Mycena sp. CBHHK59/15]
MQGTRSSIRSSSRSLRSQATPRYLTLHLGTHTPPHRCKEYRAAILNCACAENGGVATVGDKRTERACFQTSGGSGRARDEHRSSGRGGREEHCEAPESSPSTPKSLRVPITQKASISVRPNENSSSHGSPPPALWHSRCPSPLPRPLLSRRRRPHLYSAISFSILLTSLHAALTTPQHSPRFVSLVAHILDLGWCLKSGSNIYIYEVDVIFSDPAPPLVKSML